MERKINIEFFMQDQTFDNRAVGSGVYIIELLYPGGEKPIPLYIGESVYMAKRGGEHLFELFSRPECFGLTEAHMKNSQLTIKFSVLEAFAHHNAWDSAKMERRKREKELISEYAPVLQKPNSDWVISEEERCKVIDSMLK